VAARAFNRKVLGLLMCVPVLCSHTQHVNAAAASSQSASEQLAQASARDAIGVVEAAAKALGGIDKVRNVRNITAYGYAMYVYDFGGGRITGSEAAPDRLIAANDLRRTYDLENDRFQLVERRNYLFPFLAKAGHDFRQTKITLDGDIAFITNGEKTRRMARWEDSTQWLDGPVMERMWMLNNPVALVRAMLAPEVHLGAPRAEGSAIAIDVTLEQGYRLTAGFGLDGLPAWVRWAAPHTNLGQVNLTTTFSGWSEIEGLRLPLGYVTKTDWRDTRYLDLFVDAYEINGTIENLAAPANVRNAPEPDAFPRLTLTAEEVGKGIWRLYAGHEVDCGTTVVEFSDHLVIYELNIDGRQAKQVLDYVRSLVPGKPIRYLIPSHEHFSHNRGVRTAVAEGITVISRPLVGAQIAETLERAAPEYPDELSRNPQPFKFIPFDEHMRLQDSFQTLDLYWVRNNGHMADGVIAHAPEQKVLMEGDVATAASDYQHWPDNLRDMISHYKLQVERISPVHTPIPGKTVLTLVEVDQFLKEGTERARKHCEEKRVAGVFHPGCPIKSRYY
jgi:hypothetical protein